METYMCHSRGFQSCRALPVTELGRAVDVFETKKKYFALATAININAPTSETTSERRIRHQHPYAFVLENTNWTHIYVHFNVK